MLRHNSCYYYYKLLQKTDFEFENESGETTQENLLLSPNANMPSCIHPTLTPGTLAGLCHQVGASNLIHAGHGKKEEREKKCISTGRSL